MVVRGRVMSGKGEGVYKVDSPREAGVQRSIYNHSIRIFSPHRTQSLHITFISVYTLHLRIKSTTMANTNLKDFLSPLTSKPPAPKMKYNRYTVPITLLLFPPTI